MLIACRPEFPCAAASGKSQAFVFLRDPKQILKLFSLSFDFLPSRTVRVSVLHKPWVGLTMKSLSHET